MSRKVSVGMNFEVMKSFKGDKIWISLASKGCKHRLELNRAMAQVF